MINRNATEQMANHDIGLRINVCQKPKCAAAGGAAGAGGTTMFEEIGCAPLRSSSPCWWHDMRSRNSKRMTALRKTTFNTLIMEFCTAGALIYGFYQV